MIGVGQTIGNYRITAKLGEGGMGVVYLAEHPVIGKKVALKAIHPELSRNAEVVSRFMNEAKSANQIGHEHIVDIADFGNTADGEFYFIMEFLQGEQLAERLKREVRLVPGRAIGIAAQIADALGASHEHGIIHRDLKPENIFLLARGGSPDFVKVLDFGLAKLTAGDVRVTHKTRAGSLMGTPYYMSPEQCEGRTDIDHRSDIYSLGVLVFEMVTGKVPFGGEGYGEIIVKHITMPPPSVRKVVADLPEELDPILYRAMAKDREQRFQTMAEFHAALADPRGYAVGAPSIGVPPADQFGVAQAARPMSRSEMELRPARTPSVTGTAPTLTSPTSGIPSTFRHAVGEVRDEMAAKPKTSRALIFVTIVSVSTAAVTAISRWQERRPLPAVAPAAPARPTAVRVNFNSDPTGADIVAGGGKVLGRTPLSIELPYSDQAAEFVFRKTGYEPKSMYIVPNLPSPLFATLHPIEAAKPPPAVEPKKERAGGSARKRHKDRERTDDDAVLAPSF